MMWVNKSKSQKSQLTTYRYPVRRAAHGQKIKNTLNPSRHSSPIADSRIKNSSPPIILMALAKRIFDFLPCPCAYNAPSTTCAVRIFDFLIFLL
jgi:hypothetical protein